MLISFLLIGLSDQNVIQIELSRIDYGLDMKAFLSDFKRFIWMHVMAATESAAHPAEALQTHRIIKNSVGLFPYFCFHLKGRNCSHYSGHCMCVCSLTFEGSKRIQCCSSDDVMQHLTLKAIVHYYSSGILDCDWSVVSFLWYK